MPVRCFDCSPNLKRTALAALLALSSASLLGCPGASCPTGTVPTAEGRCVPLSEADAGAGDATSPTDAFAPPDGCVLQTYYADADGDGFGDASVVRMGCAPLAGFVTNDDDCNDDCAACFPGNPEVCDGNDNNCADGVDEGVLTSFFVDADMDGFGSSNTAMACSLAPGLSTTSTDCNDSDMAAFPEAAERCNGADDDCDSVSDEGLQAFLDAPIVLVDDAFGYAPAGAVLGDGYALAWSRSDGTFVSRFSADGSVMGTPANIATIPSDFVRLYATSPTQLIALFAGGCCTDITLSARVVDLSSATPTLGPTVTVGTVNGGSSAAADALIFDGRFYVAYRTPFPGISARSYTIGLTDPSAATVLTTAVARRVELEATSTGGLLTFVQGTEVQIASLSLAPLAIAGNISVSDASAVSAASVTTGPDRIALYVTYDAQPAQLVNVGRLGAGWGVLSRTSLHAAPPTRSSRSRPSDIAFSTAGVDVSSAEETLSQVVWQHARVRDPITPATATRFVAQTFGGPVTLRQASNLGAVFTMVSPAPGSNRQELRMQRVGCE